MITAWMEQSSLSAHHIAQSGAVADPRIRAAVVAQDRSQGEEVREQLDAYGA
jgi:hypothetical protein